jgi:transcriptional antiterminator RfaH
MTIDGTDDLSYGMQVPGQPPAAWHAIWTRSRTEHVVSEQLMRQGFEVFNPMILTWARMNGVRRRRPQPLFPGYLFVHHAMDRHAQVEILKARGVVRILGESWDRLAAIPSDEIDAVRRMVESGSPVNRHRFTSGDRVRITGGPLIGLTGVFVRSRQTRGLFLVSIALLRRSIAVEVDAALVEAA